MFITITLVMVALLVGLDQLIKYLVITNVKPVDAVPVLDNILQFRYVENTGAAFSILSEKTWLLSLITGVLIVGALLYLFIKKPNSKLECVSIILVVSGGLGNLIDRIFRGYVVDFIEYLFMEYAVHNFADILVTIGAILLVISIFLDKGETDA